MNDARDYPVVILNMHYTGLGLARALSAYTRRIHALGAQPSLFGNCSRFCQFARSPDTQREPEACRHFLLEFARGFEQRPLLFPTRDHDVHFIIRFRAELDAGYRIIAPPTETLATMLDKGRLYDTARRLSVPLPATCWIEDVADLASARMLRFPCIVKPVTASQWRREGVWEIVGRRKAVVMQDYAALEAFYRRLEPYDPRGMIQEYIDGPDSDLVVFGSYRNSSGRLAWFTGRKLLQYPAHSGTGVAVRACRIPAIIAQSKRLLEGLDYLGVSEIEYKYDRAARNYKLIEINTRHWDQHSIGADCGVDLSRVLYEDVVSERWLNTEQTEKSTTWIAEDSLLVSVLSNLRQRAYPWSTYAEALRAPRRLAVYAREDRRPALHLLHQTVSALGGRLRFGLRQSFTRRRSTTAE